MTAESKKINGIPRRVAPLFMLLNLKALMISINMETHAVVVLTGDGRAVDKECRLIVTPVINKRLTAKTAMFAITSTPSVPLIWSQSNLHLGEHLAFSQNVMSFV